MIIVKPRSRPGKMSVVRNKMLSARRSGIENSFCALKLAILGRRRLTCAQSSFPSVPVRASRMIPTASLQLMGMTRLIILKQNKMKK